MNHIYTLVLQIIPMVAATTVAEIATIIMAAMGDKDALKTRPDASWSDAGCVLLGEIQAKALAKEEELSFRELQFPHDGEYPHDQVWTCDQGCKHAVWNRVAVITEAAAIALLGMKPGQYILNKGYVIYDVDYSGRTSAVYNHDGRFSIIQSNVLSIATRYETHRHVGEPIEKVTGGEGSLAMTLGYIAAPDDIEIKNKQRCPDCK